MTRTSNIKTMDVNELSHLLFRPVVSIKNDLYRKPKSLPPRIVMPGSTRLLWLESDVFAWMEQCRQVIEIPKVVPIRATQKLDRRY